MNKPVLVVMAAGMGSRFGGLKQLEPLGPNGEIIIDYSIYDAKKAGFETVVFIIKKSIEEQFKNTIGKRLKDKINVIYAYQETDDLPEGFTMPKDRVKPWGTAHAIASVRDIIASPFAVINADDYYGPDAFRVIYDYLSKEEKGDKLSFCMVAYELKNTLTENGYVSRGVCSVDNNDILLEVVERENIQKTNAGAKFTTDNGKTYQDIDTNSLVSMNLWGFSKEFAQLSFKGFSEFLKTALETNPLKAEYYLPFCVSELIKDNTAQVKVLKSKDKWYGITYKEDKDVVIKALKEMHEDKKYPNDII